MRQDLAAVEEEFRGGAVDCLAGADAVGVVLIAVGVAAVEDPPQLELFYSAIPIAFMTARNSAASPPALAALVASIVYQEYSKS